MFIGAIHGFLNFFHMFLRVSEGHSFPPPLSSEEEAECFKKMKGGDMAARDKLIKHNLRLVAHIVKKYYTSYDEQEDLISIGTIGLIKAIDSFKPDSGIRFATYGSKCLQNEILMYFRAKKKTSLEISIDETIDTDKDGNPLTYMDIISVDDTIADDIFTKNCLSKTMWFIENKLDSRERAIILLRYGLSGEDPLTQREVAKRLNISRSYVSRIEKAAVKRMEEYLGVTDAYN